MQKIIAFCILYFLTFSTYADTCPLPNRFLVKKGNHYQVISPAGWSVEGNKTEQYSDMCKSFS